MNKDYLRIAGNVHLSYYVEAADILGIKYNIIFKNLTARFEYQGRHWFINNTALPVNNAPSSRLARAKNYANRILDLAGVPVPKQAKVETVEEAIDFFNTYKQVVLKPSQNLGGKGISILPQTEEDVRKAYQYAADHDKHQNVLIEQYIHGENYRILAIGEKVIGVVKRLPAIVTGDGVSTIKQLIENTNELRKTRLLMPIPIDEETVKHLTHLNLSLETILGNGIETTVRSNTNLTTGGTTEECSEIVHPFYKELAVKALKALDLEFGGVDLITNDITQPTECAINEVNYNPGLRLHYKVDKGEVKKVAVPIMEYIRDRYLAIK
ncbi:MAG: Cyanophycin synthetase [candidate division WS6 bacterium GW2011_GWF2_39_15]|uniref:Cyanophycin synthetase n=1 Tax=candidate division WS6 bacterium GW2011_GWF2_39_15 TaxID=1619100 RepID=A0A0G0QXM0_9BACT|nr:MAG: Cyanophycin synthetase [candidate division WS6 bacterium GW2011_GWF2_39_15]